MRQKKNVLQSKQGDGNLMSRTAIFADFRGFQHPDVENRKRKILKKRCALAVNLLELHCRILRLKNCPNSRLEIAFIETVIHTLENERAALHQQYQDLNRNYPRYLVGCVDNQQIFIP